MRLWSISLTYLDKAGLLAVWREALLAKKILENKTLGYKNHPQLIRFQNTSSSIEYINSYLTYIYEEAQNRGYHFSKEKFIKTKINKPILVTSKQIAYEFQHLQKKLKKRSPNKFAELSYIKKIEAGDIFKIINGEIEPWEKVY